MAVLALMLLLATCGTAHAARHSVLTSHDAIGARHTSVAKHNATASGAAQHNATDPYGSEDEELDPGVEEGTALFVYEDAYILEWSESAEAWGFLEENKAKGNEWTFITPVMCRRSGMWYKLKIEHDYAMKKCLEVTCNLDGDVERVQPENLCAEETNKLLRTHGPYAVKNEDGTLIHVPHFANQMPPIDMSQAVTNGWSFDSETIQSFLREHEQTSDYFDFIEEGDMKRKYGWAMSKKCKKYRALWEEVGVMFTNEASLDACKEKRTTRRASCTANFQPLVGTATAWEVKKHWKKQELNRFVPSCATWCSKNNCYNKETPDEVKRDTAAVVAAMNSWKYTCEKELDAWLLKKVASCEAIGNVCDKPWSKFLPCAQQYSMPLYS